MKKDDKKVTKLKSREIREKTNPEELKDQKRYKRERELQEPTLGQGNLLCSSRA